MYDVCVLYSITVFVFTFIEKKRCINNNNNTTSNRSYYYYKLIIIISEEKNKEKEERREASAKIILDSIMFSVDRYILRTLNLNSITL